MFEKAQTVTAAVVSLLFWFPNVVSRISFDYLSR
jgi:hypothetical protein